jgi:hypothetical protein
MIGACPMSGLGIKCLETVLRRCKGTKISESASSCFVLDDQESSCLIRLGLDSASCLVVAVEGSFVLRFRLETFSR